MGAETDGGWWATLSSCPSARGPHCPLRGADLGPRCQGETGFPPATRPSLSRGVQ